MLTPLRNSIKLFFTLFFIFLFIFLGELPSRFGVRTTHTLRTFIAKWLHCDAMRITKKFAGSDQMGKHVYHPNVDASHQRLVQTGIEIDQLEHIFLDKLRMVQCQMDARAQQVRSVVFLIFESL